MRREVRATANRLANFDDANLRRSARAAVAAAARVERALQILGDTVPDHLAAAGKLRVEHRQASLEELGRLAEPPMTKDAVAGRIRRLLSMADRKAKQDGIPDTESAVTPICSTTPEAVRRSAVARALAGRQAWVRIRRSTRCRGQSATGHRRDDAHSPAAIADGARSSSPTTGADFDGIFDRLCTPATTTASIAGHHRHPRAPSRKAAFLPPYLDLRAGPGASTPPRLPQRCTPSTTSTRSDRSACSAATPANRDRRADSSAEGEGRARCGCTATATVSTAMARPASPAAATRS